MSRRWVPPTSGSTPPWARRSTRAAERRRARRPVGTDADSAPGGRVGGLAAAGVTVAGAAAALQAGRWLLPPTPLPAPTGPHPVGTTVIEVEGPRTLPVQVWYPSLTSQGPAARLFPSPAAPAVVAARYRIPRRLVAPLGRVRMHAVAGAPPGPTGVGVALLVHGWMGFRTIHADLAEQLASEGWVVLAADHVGGALVTQHLDGRAEGVDEALLPPPGDPEREPRSELLVQRYAADAAAVLDAVGGLRDAGLAVAGADRVLVIGQSTGGGAALALAARDRRVAAVVGLDPWVVPVDDDARRAVAVPVVALRSGGWIGGANDRLLEAMPTVRLRDLAEAGHTDLTALGYLTPALRLTGLTTVRPAVVHDAAMAAVHEAVELAELG